MAHVYLLHLLPALHHAKHYCGYTPNGVLDRVTLHKKGQGARLTKAAVEAGCELVIAKTWDFTNVHEARLFERALKNRHRLADFCPVCRANKGR